MIAKSRIFEVYEMEKGRRRIILTTNKLITNDLTDTSGNAKVSELSP